VLPWQKDCSGLAECLREVSLFLRKFRARLRAGEHSRSPLELIRLQLHQGTISCDWIARDSDPWDATLPPSVGQRHASLQALKDAIDTRSLLFESVREAECAQVRVYRRRGGSSLEAIISGGLRRDGGAFRHIHSIVMRAKLLGFRFSLEDDILSPFPPESDCDSPISPSEACVPEPIKAPSPVRTF